jgi:hypothetical protein
VSGLGFFSLFSSFGFEHHHHINYFTVRLNLLNSLDSVMPPNFVWESLIIEDFFVYFSHLPPSVGFIILARVIFSRKN